MGLGLSPQCIFKLVALHKIEIFLIHFFSYTVPKYELYRDPGEGNVIAYSVIGTTPKAFIVTIDIVYSLSIYKRKFVWKYEHSGHTYEQIS